MPRALFVSYAFPPVGGAGVQRLTKWLKYLPDLGWEASVVAAGNPSVPVTDWSLGPEVPASTQVVRARTFEPSYSLKQAVAGGSEGARAGSAARLRRLVLSTVGALLQPDPQILWVPAAVRAGRRVLSRARHDVIVATGPPYSAMLVAARLAKVANLPLVLDFRDEWDLSGKYWENRLRDPITRQVQSRMQASVLKRAQLVLATTQRSAAALAEKCELTGSVARTRCIYNGYDEEDFATNAKPTNTPDRYRLAYVGTLWALTDVEPLVEGLCQLARRSPALASKVEVVFAGRRTDAQSAKLVSLRDQPFRLTVFDYVAHAEALEIMKTSNALCLLLSDVPGAERIVPAKLFEYMASRRTILAIAPRGEARELLDGHPATHACDPRDPGSIAAALAASVENHSAGHQADWAEWDPTRFSRSKLAGQLASVLHEVVNEPRRGP